MAQVVVTMSGDEAKLFRAQQKILEQQLKLQSGYNATGKQSRESAKAAQEEAALRSKAAKEHEKELQRAAALTASLRTPQEKYNEALSDANQLKEKGAIDAETLKRRQAQLTAELEQATGVAARNSEVEKARLAVIAKNGTVSASAAAAIKRYEAELKELDTKQKAGAISAEQLAFNQAKVKREFQNSVGLADKQNTLIGSATSQLTAYASAAGVAGVAIGVIRAGWETINEEQQKGLDALKATQDSSRALLQISDTAEEFNSLKSQAQVLSSSSGVPLERVEGVLFSAVSEGFRDAVPDIIAANQVVDVNSAAGVAGQVPALFQGAIGSLEAVDLTLKAARDSRLNFEQIAKSLPQAAEGAAVAKATPEETLAVLSVLASRFKSGDVDADRIKAFATKVVIDAGGGDTDEEFQEKVDKEKAKVATAEKQLRAKEERVADLEKRLDNAKATEKEGIQTQLERAKRDVSEFDRTRLEFNAPERGSRESLAGIGIVAAVEKLQAMSEVERADFLKDSQELNTVYIALTEELETIKQREKEITEERAKFAAGGGLLRERIAIAAGNEQLAAVKNNDIATQKLEEAYRSGKGIEGATADSAVKDVERNLVETGSFGARVANTVGAPGVVARAAAAAGADQEQATTVGTDFAEFLGFGGSLIGALRVISNKMSDSADSQAKAAAAMERASKNPGQPPTDAARIQAGLANQPS